MSEDFARRLDPLLPGIAAHFGTPFHIYDLQGLHDTATGFNDAFRGLAFREYFAVKGQPNPAMLRRIAEYGFGFDCSSPAELAAATMAGARGEDICFTSNNTSHAELAEALRLGAIITVDDETVLDKLIELGGRPRSLAIRVHPGAAAAVDLKNEYLGDTESAKFGVRTDRLPAVAAKAAALRPERFGLHMMLGSGLLHPEPFLLTLDLLLAETVRLPQRVDFLNLGGGIGIPYRPGERAFDLPALARAVSDRLAAHPGPTPRLLFECGRYILTPHGVLVTRVLNRMSKWREIVGVDAGMNALPRPAMYPHAYHHVTVHGGADRPLETVDVAGSLCENNDKFAIQRELPQTREGDLLLVHDTGAHALSMAFTYNGRLRPQELVLHPDGTVARIRRAETIADYFATLDCDADTLSMALP